LAQGAAESAGRLSPAAAAETGLNEGTLVITGTGDSAAEALSVGVLKPGSMMIQFGSTVFIYCCVDRRLRDDRLRGNLFVVPGTYSIAGSTNTAGTLTTWFKDNLFDLRQEAETTGQNEYDLMLRGLEDISPGSGGLVTLPYFAGERSPLNNPAARGCVFGLTLKHTRTHLYRSALEGIGFSIAQMLDIITEQGFPVEHIMIAGGGVKNTPWMQIVADILNRPLKKPRVSVGASYGDALLAAMGAGVFSSFGEMEKLISPGRVFTPDIVRHEQYKPYRRIFDELYVRTKDLMGDL
jgi:xylulokinase